MALGGSPSVILAGESPVEKPTVTFSTTLGNVTIELFPDKAPVTVENFLAYVDSGFYNGTIFHRVVSGFVLQGGGFTEEMSQKPTRSPIKNEADNGLKNKRGTLSMARTRDIKSATSQFFINLKDNRFLDNGARDFGYAVFGKVMEGMEVVDKISAVRTGNRGPYRNVPLEPVVIRSARRK
jgi:peptidyl-prolyl cis-trans isomerase A (cyclophilin A)